MYWKIPEKLLYVCVTGKIDYTKSEQFALALQQQLSRVQQPILCYFDLLDATANNIGNMARNVRIFRYFGAHHFSEVVLVCDDDSLAFIAEALCKLLRIKSAIFTARQDAETYVLDCLAV